MNTRQESATPLCYAVDEDAADRDIPRTFFDTDARETWIEESPLSRHEISQREAERMRLRNQERGATWRAAMTPEERMDHDSIMGLDA
jgi:hypothetical protein